MSHSHDGARTRDLTRAQRAELALALKDRRREIPLENGIHPIPDAPNYAASFAQERIWFLESFSPGTATFNVPVALRFKGSLNEAALERALTNVAMRHEALRTSVVARDGQPFQVIHPAAPTLTRIDVGYVPISQRDTFAVKAATWEARSPFDLDADLLFRMKLLRFDVDDQLLLCTAHHLITDASSIAIMLREISDYYNAEKDGRKLALPLLSTQYRDYAHWQHSQSGAREIEYDWEYWRDKLDGHSHELALPLDRVRPRHRLFQAETVAIEISRELHNRISMRCREEAVSKFMFLLAALTSLLSRYSGEQDIAVGTHISGRHSEEVRAQIGVFINTLVMRTQLPRNATFRDVLYRAKETALEAYAHQQIPFEHLVERLRPERDPSRNPLFQVTLALNSESYLVPPLSELETSDVAARTSTTEFDLCFQWTENSQGCSLDCRYDIALFERNTVDRLVNDYRMLVESTVDQLDIEVAAIPLGSVTQYPSVALDSSNSISVESEIDLIHEIISQRTIEAPELVALEASDGVFTRNNVEIASNQLASYLQQQGATSGSRVGLMLTRSSDLIVTILAILKLGATFIPLDPGQPKNRLARTLQNSDTSIVVSDGPHFVGLDALRIRELRLDHVRAAIQSQPSVFASAPGREAGLAYIVYTSGSTGGPKGVAVSCGALSRRICEFIREPGITAGDCFAAVTTIGFDIAILELLAPLAAGAKLVVIDDETASDGKALGQRLTSTRATLMQATPATWQMLIDSGWSAPPTGFAAWCGGDALSQSLASEILDTGARLWNLYGPTECTIWATRHHVTDAALPISIGRAIVDCTAYVLNERLEPVPLGALGCLYIGGHGLAHGYWNDPRQTAERFIPSPYAASGERLYDTGDFVRQRPNGELEFLGRRDGQIKLRGHRIELPEIEAMIHRCDGVRDTAVVLRGDSNHTGKIVGYVVFESTQDNDTTRIRDALRSELPDYMIPSILVSIESLPLTPNRKIDRKALLELDHGFEPTTSQSPPQTEVEHQVTSLWSQILENPILDIDADFFELGGHSLLATRVIARLEASFQIDLGVRALFDSPTIRQLALHIESTKRSNQSLSYRPKTRAADAPLELSFGQERIWFLDRLEPGSTAYHIPAAFRLSGHLDIDALRGAIQDLVNQHESLRTSFQLDDSGLHQVIEDKVEIPFNVVHADSERTDHQAVMHEFAQLESDKPFDLDTGPLLHAALLTLGPTEYVLCMSLHHIVSDGWSIGIVFKELSEHYSARVVQPSSAPLNRGLQCADHALWQRECLANGLLDDQFEYWRTRLGSPLPPLDFPLDRPRPAKMTSLGARVLRSYDELETKRLREVAQQEYVTPAMLLGSALAVMIGRYSRTTDVALGMPIANRRFVEFEHTIGYLANTVVLRTDLSGDPTFCETLGRVKQGALEAYENQDAPFERVVREVGPDRDLSQNPLFQVLFVVHVGTRETLRFHGLESIPVEFETRATRFDLEVHAFEERDSFGFEWIYNCHLFEHETVVRLVESYCTLLSAAVKRPEAPISSFPLLPPKNIARVLELGSGESRESPLIAVHELVKRKAVETPDAIAVTDDRETITYVELERKSDALSAKLISAGVSAESPVAIDVERSVRQMIAILATLKSAGVCVPIDRDAPLKRRIFMMNDSGAKVVIGDSPQSFDGCSAQTRRIELDADWNFSAESQLDPPPIHAENVAYLLYTSGSTGIPKAVAMPHRGLTNLIGDQLRSLSPAAGRTVLQFASIGFDVSFQEILTTWAGGGNLVIASDNERHNPVALWKLISTQGVTRVYLPFVALHRLASEMPEDAAESCQLQEIMVAGEQLQMTDSIRQLLKRLTDCTLYNQYGPTETHVVSTADVTTTERTLPDIGRAIENTQLLTLNSRYELMPPGVEGEICVAGPSLARGYWNRPSLTAARFTPDPFGRPGSRMYHTGDFGRSRWNGTFDFSRREDEQVKVRGIRIELGEIEAALVSLPSVTAAAVAIDRRDVGDERIVAFVSGDDLPSTLEIRRTLRLDLPVQLLPNEIIALDSFPMTSSGKLDRRQLIEKFCKTDRLGDRPVPPETSAELVMAEIWCEVLEISEVGIHENFFDLGGHSLQSVRVLNEIHRRFGVELPVREMFVQTLGQIAARCEPGL